MKTLTMAAILALGAFHSETKIVLPEPKGIRVAENAKKSKITSRGQGNMSFSSFDLSKEHEH